MRINEKKGFFFSTDALIALVVIILVLLVAFPFVKTTKRESVLQEDTIKVFSSLKVGDIENSYVEQLIAEKKIKEPSRTILEQIGEFYVTNKTLARTLAVEMLEYLNTSENIGIWYNNELLASKNTSTYESAENVETARQVISGISATTVNGSITGYSARAWLSSILSEKYFYFGGYVGDGNISIIVNYSGKLEDVELEIVTNRDFKLYINGNFSGQYENSSSVFAPAKYPLGAYNSSFNASRENVIKLEGVGGSLYIAGGFVKIIYESYEPYQLEKRYSFPGIEGLINVYDGFYIPGQLNTLDIMLHLNSNYTTFLTIGNKTIFNGSTSGEEIITLDNSYLSSVLNYSQLSQKTIPFRLGLENVSYTTSISKPVDVFSVTDISGSMYEDLLCAGVTCGRYRCCGSSCGLCNSQGEQAKCESCGGTMTGKIFSVKNANKEFIDIVLNNSLNRVGLAAYSSSALDSNFHSLSTNVVSLKTEVDSWIASGSTCICCGINKAVNALYTTSSPDKFTSIVVMSDGEANVECSQQGNTSDLNGNGGADDAGDDAVQAACDAWQDYGIKVYAIGFGSDVDAETMQAIASCGNGSYYYGNISDIIDIYKQVAQEIIEASYKEQTIEVTGNISTILYPDSYIEFNYAGDGIPYGLITSVEKQFYDGYFGSFSVPPALEILETKTISYSGPRWTASVEINNNSIYNLSTYGERYTELGDPYSINIPNSFVEQDNVVKITTGTSPTNSSPGSQSNKIIHTTKQNSTSFSEIVAFAEGCNWEIEFEGGAMINISIPEEYIGAQYCYYKSSRQEISNDYDAIQIAVKNLLQLLDFDSTGRIDVIFTEQNLKISSSEITDIPYLVSTEVQVRRWW